MSDDEGAPLPSSGAARSESAGAGHLGSKSTYEVVDAALRMVTALAESTVANADGVSVTLERHGRLMTVAASDGAILEMDRHQYESGEGPCLAAKAEGHWFYVESLDEETRWPMFVPLALAQGIHSILSSPLMTADRPQGALNIYSNTTHAFGEREQGLAALFARQASQVLTTAAADITEDQANARFLEALQVRQLIARAEGVVMARQGVHGEAASTILRRSARDQGLSVTEYATKLVESVGKDPSSGV